MRQSLVTTLVLSVALLGSLPGYAHDVGLSRSDWTLDGERLSVTLAFAAADATSLPHPADLLRATMPSCAAEVGPLRDDDDGVLLEVSFSCRPTAVQLAFLSSLPRGHRHVASANGGARVLHQGADTLSLSAATPPRGALAWIGIGVEHILIGWDHLAFLFGLVLVLRQGRRALAIVTAFTAGHSVTLALAALHVVAPEPRLVEALIAASVVFVGVENLVGARTDRRWMIALAFGLLHGFGFAGVLADVGLPERGAVLALALFNVGVEVGQLVVLCALWPLLVLARRRFESFDSVGVKAASSALCAIGLLWLLERIA